MHEITKEKKDLLDSLSLGVIREYLEDRQHKTVLDDRKRRVAKLVSSLNTLNTFKEIYGFYEVELKRYCPINRAYQKLEDII
jgi:hypothetical protein